MSLFSGMLIKRSAGGREEKSSSSSSELPTSSRTITASGVCTLEAAACTPGTSSSRSSDAGGSHASLSSTRHDRIENHRSSSQSSSIPIFSHIDPSTTFPSNRSLAPRPTSLSASSVCTPEHSHSTPSAALPLSNVSLRSPPPSSSSSRSGFSSPTTAHSLYDGAEVQGQGDSSLSEKSVERRQRGEQAFFFLSRSSQSKTTDEGPPVSRSPCSAEAMKEYPLAFHTHREELASPLSLSSLAPGHTTTPEKSKEGELSSTTLSSLQSSSSSGSHRTSPSSSSSLVGNSGGSLLRPWGIYPSSSSLLSRVTSEKPFSSASSSSSSSASGSSSSSSAFSFLQKKLPLSSSSSSSSAQGDNISISSKVSLASPRDDRSPPTESDLHSKHPDHKDPCSLSPSSSSAPPPTDSSSSFSLDKDHTRFHSFTPQPPYPVSVSSAVSSHDVSVEKSFSSLTSSSSLSQQQEHPSSSSSSHFSSGIIKKKSRSVKLPGLCLVERAQQEARYPTSISPPFASSSPPDLDRSSLFEEERRTTSEEERREGRERRELHPKGAVPYDDEDSRYFHDGEDHRFGGGRYEEEDKERNEGGIVSMLPPSATFHGRTTVSGSLSPHQESLRKGYKQSVPSSHGGSSRKVSRGGGGEEEDKRDAEEADEHSCLYLNGRHERDKVVEDRKRERRDERTTTSTLPLIDTASISEELLSDVERKKGVPHPFSKGILREQKEEDREEDKRQRDVQISHQSPPSSSFAFISSCRIRRDGDDDPNAASLCSSSSSLRQTKSRISSSSLTICETEGLEQQRQYGEDRQSRLKPSDDTDPPSKFSFLRKSGLSSTPSQDHQPSSTGGEREQGRGLGSPRLASEASSSSFAYENRGETSHRDRKELYQDISSGEVDARPARRERRTGGASVSSSALDEEPYSKLREGETSFLPPPRPTSSTATYPSSSSFSSSCTSSSESCKEEEKISAWYYVCRSNHLRLQQEETLSLAEAIEEQRKIAEDLRVLGKEKSRLLLRQEKCIEKEDFETAAQIDGDLSALQKKYDLLLRIFPSTQQRRQNEAIKKSCEIAERLLDETHSMQRDLQDIFEKKRQEKEKKHTERVQRRQEEEQALKTASEELQGRLRECEEKVAGTANAFKALKTLEMEGKEEVKNRLRLLQEDQLERRQKIDDLRRELAALEEEWREKEEEIACVEKEYDRLEEDCRREEEELRREQRRLQERERSLEDEEVKLQHRREALHAEETAFEKLQQENEEREASLVSSLRSFDSRIAFLKALLKLRQAVYAKLQSSSAGAALEERQAEMARLLEEKEALRAELLHQEEVRVRLRGEQQRQVLLLPLLQQEKELAVASRHFKEAASFSTEIKNCQEVVEETKQKVDACTQAIKHLQKDLDAREPALEQLRTAQVTAQKNLQRVQRNLLSRQLRSLEKLKPFCPEERDSLYRQAIDEEVAVYRRLLDLLWEGQREKSPRHLRSSPAHPTEPEGEEENVKKAREAGESSRSQEKPVESTRLEEEEDRYNDGGVSDSSLISESDFEEVRVSKESREMHAETKELPSAMVTTQHDDEEVRMSLEKPCLSSCMEEHPSSSPFEANHGDLCEDKERRDCGGDSDDAVCEGGQEESLLTTSLRRTGTSITSNEDEAESMKAGASYVLRSPRRSKEEEEVKESEDRSDVRNNDEEERHKETVTVDRERDAEEDEEEEILMRVAQSSPCEERRKKTKEEGSSVDDGEEVEEQRETEGEFEHEEQEREEEEEKNQRTPKEEEEETIPTDRCDRIEDRLSLSLKSGDLSHHDEQTTKYDEEEEVGEDKEEILSDRKDAEASRSAELSETLPSDDSRENEGKNLITALEGDKGWLRDGHQEAQSSSRSAEEGRLSSVDVVVGCEQEECCSVHTSAEQDNKNDSRSGNAFPCSVSERDCGVYTPEDLEENSGSRGSGSPLPCRISLQAEKKLEESDGDEGVKSTHSLVQINNGENDEEIERDEAETRSEKNRNRPLGSLETVLLEEQQQRDQLEIQQNLLHVLEEQLLMINREEMREDSYSGSPQQDGGLSSVGDEALREQIWSVRTAMEETSRRIEELQHTRELLGEEDLTRNRQGNTNVLEREEKETKRDSYQGTHSDTGRCSDRDNERSKQETGGDGTSGVCTPDESNTRSTSWKKTGDGEQRLNHKVDDGEEKGSASSESYRVSEERRRSANSSSSRQASYHSESSGGSIFAGLQFKSRSGPRPSVRSGGTSREGEGETRNQASGRHDRSEASLNEAQRVIKESSSHPFDEEAISKGERKNETTELEKEENPRPGEVEEASPISNGHTKRFRESTAQANLVVCSQAYSGVELAPNELFLSRSVNGSSLLSERSL
ncbi:hypothetical protein CSUI_004306 [Cystoisospora suis]|uniref:Uncharacterized protein n=1 Tax=Cystoisospora suis TaxID=483139 RepID=A0A2C6KZ81_9APIC|nr:hypothetical protein CSUI_004306 [Cystoisospora suis]